MFKNAYAYYGEMIMKKRNWKTGLLAATVVAAAVGLSGCGGFDNSSTEEEYRLKGIDALAIGNYDEAISDFQNALEESLGGIGNLEVDICLYEAEAMYLSGDAESALNLYTSLIDYKKYADVYYLRGNLYFAEEKENLAIQDFEEAMSRDSDNYDLYVAVFDTMKKYGRTEEGEVYLKQALEISGEKAEDYMQKGRIYYLLQDIEGAETDLQQAIDMGCEEANYYMFQVYIDKEDTAGAEEYFDAYINSGVATPERLMKIGENDMNNGDYDIALKFLEAGLNMNETECYQQLMRDTIIAYEYNGDFSSARSLMRTYVENYPNDYDAEDELTFLETR